MSCKHYREEGRRLPQIGGPPQPYVVAFCKLLERAEPLTKLTMNDAMARAGGSSMETTQCAFGTRFERCPYYEAAP